MAYTEFTLWLTPGEPHRALLRSTISRLAARFDAVEFEPHVTVFCGPSTDAEACAVARRGQAVFPDRVNRGLVGPHGTLYEDSICSIPSVFWLTADLRDRRRALFQTIELYPEPASKFDL